MPQTADILSRVRQVEFRSRRLVSNAIVGSWHSVFKGRGLDFEEVREYAPGDDVRTIDWNVTAKTDKPFIKKFREERERAFVLLVDVSASGSFGTTLRTKRDTAAELACVLAFAAAKNNDKIGLALFTDDVEHYVPPAKGRRQLLRIVRDILSYEPKRRGTDVTKALAFLRRVHRRPTVAFLVSDFLVPETPQPGQPDPASWSNLFRLLAVANQRHEVICFPLSDPREQTLPDVGRLRLEDAETGLQYEINTGDESVRRRYAEGRAHFAAALTRSLRKSGVGFLPISTGKPFTADLTAFFARRIKRL